MTSDNSALQRRALAALILAESQGDGGRQGTRLPTERQLALDLGVSRSAIRHAMALLQAEGHVSREVGRGTFLRGVPDAGAAGPAKSVGPAEARGRHDHPDQGGLRPPGHPRRVLTSSRAGWLAAVLLPRAAPPPAGRAEIAAVATARSANLKAKMVRTGTTCKEPILAS